MQVSFHLRSRLYTAPHRRGIMCKLRCIEFANRARSHETFTRACSRAVHTRIQPTTRHRPNHLNFRQCTSDHEIHYIFARECRRFSTRVFLSNWIARVNGMSVWGCGDGCQHGMECRNIEFVWRQGSKCEGYVHTHRVALQWMQNNVDLTGNCFLIRSRLHLTTQSVSYGLFNYSYVLVMFVCGLLISVVRSPPLQRNSSRILQGQMYFYYWCLYVSVVGWNHSKFSHTFSVSLGALCSYIRIHSVMWNVSG